jgi:DNA polymerase (family 10)
VSSPANQQLARLFHELSVLADLQGLDPFRGRAYAGAARTFEILEADAAELAARGALTSLRGIGPGLAGLTEDFLRTGTSAALDELRAAVPPGLLELLRIQGLGPKKARALYAGLGITSIPQLEEACRQGHVGALHGFGAKTQAHLLRGIEQLRQYHGLFRVDHAWAAVRWLESGLAGRTGIGSPVLAGGLRRCCEVVDGVDLVLAGTEPEAGIDTWADLPPIVEATSPAPDRIDLRLDTGLPVRLHIVPPASLPARVHELTGSPEYLQQMQARAQALGMELGPDGPLRERRPLPCPGEASLFAHLGLAWIPPELREGRGEVEAAADGTLPALVERTDLRGLLHAHTTFSDGRASLSELAAQARRLGYQYLGIADHSRSAAYAGGLSVEAVGRQHAEIDEYHRRADGPRLFRGIESDILPDGGLDYDDEVLARFDFVVASVHSQLQMDREAMTRRLLRAIEHPRTSILGHPTGRLLLEREGYPVDLDAVLRAAARAGVAVEINAHPQRLELDWRHLRRARDLGVRFAINPDAHQPSDLEYLDLGVGIARKGWLRREDVVNCLDADALAACWSRRRGGG